MSGELHHSKYMVKMNTVGISSFQPPGTGPTGAVRGSRVVMYTKIVKREHIRPRKIDARVDLIRFAMGMDGSLLDAALGLGAKGIVLEA